MEWFLVQFSVIKAEEKIVRDWKKNLKEKSFSRLEQSLDAIILVLKL